MSLHLAIRMAFGLESVVQGELKALGYQKFSTKDGEISLIGEPADIARLNLWLRAADRVVVRVGEYEARDLDTFFDRAVDFNWHDYIDISGKFPVTGFALDSEIKSVRTVQSMLKKAVATALQRGHQVTTLPESGAEYPIEFGIRKDRVHLDINTTGEGLHRRGYRLNSGAAPLRETLAAGVILLSGWDGMEPLFDPCCGSGTLLTEAALIAANICPGLGRAFCSEGWSWLGRNYWSEEREKATAGVQVIEYEICGSDRDSKAIDSAIENAKRAGVSLKLGVEDLRTVKFKSEFGTVVANPPYGERMGDTRELKELYKNFRALMERSPGWRFWILSGDERFEGGIGAKSDKKRKLYNGSMRVDLYGYREQG